MPEPRDPLLKVFRQFKNPRTERFLYKEFFEGVPVGFTHRSRKQMPPKGRASKGREVNPTIFTSGDTLDNDPSAGSPTETLLRLLLPLNDRV